MNAINLDTLEKVQVYKRYGIAYNKEWDDVLCLWIKFDGTAIWEHQIIWNTWE